MEKTELINKANQIRNGWFFTVEYQKQGSTAEGDVVRVTRRRVRKGIAYTSMKGVDVAPDEVKVNTWLEMEEANPFIGNYCGNDEKKMGRTYFRVAVTRNRKGHVCPGTTRYYFVDDNRELTAEDIERLKGDLKKIAPRNPQSIIELDISGVTGIYCKSIA